MNKKRRTLITLTALLLCLLPALLYAGGSSEKEQTEEQSRGELVSFSVYSGDDTRTGHQIMEEANDMLLAGNIAADITMILENEKGNQRVRELRIISQEKDGLNRSVLHFTSPADIEGTGFLMIETPSGDSDMWLYLPELTKVRRIVSAGKSESFMGSDITYADMEGRNVDEYTYTRYEDETVDDQACYVVGAVPLNGSGEYARTIYSVSREHLVPLKALMFSPEGTYVKQMRMKELEHIDDTWIPTLIEVENVLEKHRTIMTLRNIELNTEADDSYFTQQYLKRGK